MWTDGRAIVYNMLCICTLKSLQSSVSRLPGMQKLGSKSLRRPCVSNDVILHVFIFFVDRKHNYMSRDYRVHHVFPQKFPLEMFSSNSAAKIFVDCVRGFDSTGRGSNSTIPI